jgi:hypothetical protein
MKGEINDSTKRTFIPFYDLQHTEFQQRRAVASMGVKDTATNKYIRQNHIFADAFNFFIYGGQQVIDPNTLVELDTKVLDIVYGDTDSEDHLIQRYRDVIKSSVIMTDQKKTYLIFAVENQSEIHYAMPVKNCMYDATQYSMQVQKTAAAHKRNKTSKGLLSGEYLSGFHKTDKLLPVITLVIYFGDKKWDGPLSLHAMFEEQDEKILSLVPDYKLNLIVPADIPDRKYDCFQSDLKEVLSFIKYAKDKQKLQEILASDTSFQSIGKDAIDVINACTGAKLKQEEKEVVDVCQAIQEIADEAAEKAREEVMKEKNSMLIKSIKALMEKAGLTLEQSMSALDLSESDRENLIPLI